MPQPRNYYTVDGKLNAMPFNSSNPLLYMNTAMLAKAGIPYRNSWRLSDLEAYRRMALKAARIWRDHGALAVCECVAEDLKVKMGIPFPRRVKPKAGDSAIVGSGELKWQDVSFEDYVITFTEFLGRGIQRSVAAYAVCYTRSEIEQHGLQMLVGSDDLSKVYLNGKQVHKTPAMLRFVRDGDRVLDSSQSEEISMDEVFKLLCGGEEYVTKERLLEWDYLQEIMQVCVSVCVCACVSVCE